MTTALTMGRPPHFDFGMSSVDSADRMVLFGCGCLWHRATPTTFPLLIVCERHAVPFANALGFAVLLVPVLNTKGAQRHLDEITQRLTAVDGLVGKLTARLRKALA